MTRIIADSKPTPDLEGEAEPAPDEGLEAETDAGLEEPDEAVIADEDGATPVDDFDADDDDEAEDVAAIDKVLQNKQGSARQLAIRRALEERREARQMKEDLDYLDLDD